MYDPVHLRAYGKGEYLVQAGTVSAHSFLVETGVLRKFYLKAGVEVTTEFVFPGDLVASVTSFLEQVPGREFIQAVTACRVRLVPHELFAAAHAQHPEIAHLNFLVLQQHCRWLEQRLYELQFATAAEKYQRLLTTQPELLRHVPLGYVASYLGVTLETLSRIRAKLI